MLHICPLTFDPTCVKHLFNIWATQKHPKSRPTCSDSAWLVRGFRNGQFHHAYRSGRQDVVPSTSLSKWVTVKSTNQQITYITSSPPKSLPPTKNFPQQPTTPPEKEFKSFFLGSFLVFPASIGGRGGQFGVTLRPCLSTATSGAPENTRHRGGELGSWWFRVAVKGLGGLKWWYFLGWFGGVGMSRKNTDKKQRNHENLSSSEVFFNVFFGIIPTQMHLVERGHRRCSICLTRFWWKGCIIHPATPRQFPIQERNRIVAVGYVITNLHFKRYSNTPNWNTPQKNLYQRAMSRHFLS